MLERSICSLYTVRPLLGLGRRAVKSFLSSQHLRGSWLPTQPVAAASEFNLPHSGRIYQARVP